MRLSSLVLPLVVLLGPVAARAQWKTSVLPVVGSAPETGGQFGVAIFRTRQHADSLTTRPTSLIGNAVATTKQQRRAFIEYDRWTAGNERRLQILAIASRFPLPFYGYGAETAESDEMQYLPKTFDVGITRSRRSGESAWRYAGLRVVSTRVEEFSGWSFDCPDCAPVPPDSPMMSLSIGLPWNVDGYDLALGTVGWVKDSRDNLFAPTRGRVIDVSFAAGAVWFPLHFSTREYLGRLRVDARGYRELKDGAVLGAQLQFTNGSPEFPLDQVALLGHHTLNRGYTMGRFRDNGMLSTQLEWRGPTTMWNQRLGFAAFVGVASLTGVETLSKPLPSGGAGLRFRLDPRTRSTIRLDYARGASGQSGLYVAFNEAF